MGIIQAAAGGFASFDPIQPDKRVMTIGAVSEVSDAECEAARVISCFASVVEFVMAVILSA